MPCSFCKESDHNVRTCKALQGACKVFLTAKGASLAFGSFKEYLFAAVDMIVTGGMLTAAYAAYQKICTSIDIATFLSLTKREQAKRLLETGAFGDISDVSIGTVADAL
jgi:hypothetical protein